VDSVANVTANREPNTSITIFHALLEELDITDKALQSLGVQTGTPTILAPSDLAFQKFFTAIGGKDVDPYALIKTKADVFKQVCPARRKLRHPVP
jgi:hypothetical protein